MYFFDKHIIFHAYVLMCFCQKIYASVEKYVLISKNMSVCQKYVLLSKKKSLCAYV